MDAITGEGKCAIGLYGGKPYLGNCLACMKAGQNNQEHADKIKADYERTHPEGWRNTATVNECGC